MQAELIESHRMFGGEQRKYQHVSASCRCQMTFSAYLPPQAKKQSLPVIYWLSGLTCTDDNFSQKAGVQKYAAELGVILVMPDTSPRGEEVADDDGYDLGQGAGFYLDATQSPWSSHYKMYSYITNELPEIIDDLIANSGKKSIMGHSMGGHGALVIGLRHSDIYQSVSAFAPIANPSDCPWGQKAFLAYLGEDKESWRQYDACELIRNMDKQIPVLVDQGDADQFLVEQLHFDRLKKVCDQAQLSATLRLQKGYDHSYFFIASFIEEHLKFHHSHLTK